MILWIFQTTFARRRMKCGANELHFDRSLVDKGGRGLPLDRAASFDARRLIVDADQSSKSADREVDRAVNVDPPPPARPLSPQAASTDVVRALAKLFAEIPIANHARIGFCNPKCMEFSRIFKESAISRPHRGKVYNTFDCTWVHYDICMIYTVKSDVRR